MTFEKIQIEIPEFERHVKVSNATRAKYWKVGQKNVPKRVLKEIVGIKKFGKKQDEYWIDCNGDRFVKNTIKVGQANYWVVNGQQLYNAALGPMTRAKVTKYFHEYIKGYIKPLLPLDVIGEIRTYAEIYETDKLMTVDIDNLWLWTKWFNDVLQEMKIISNDNKTVIRSTGQITYFPVEENTERKLVFYIEPFIIADNKKCYE